MSNVHWYRYTGQKIDQIAIRMFFSENLKKKNILIGIKKKNRWNLINELVQLGVKNGEIPEDQKDAIKKSLMEREKSMSTGIGNGVAIPHCTSQDIKDTILLMAVSSTGIDFDSIDGHPVRITILLIVPKNKLTQHIKTLANIAKLMSNEQLREKIFKAKSADAVVKAIKEFENGK